MEAEPIAAQADAEMTIDYDEPLHAVSGALEASGDAEMGLDVTAPHDGVMATATATQEGLNAVTSTVTDSTGEQEAEMRDDGSVPEVDISIIDSSAPAGVEVMLEDNVAEPTMPIEAEGITTEPLVDVSFTSADEATMTTTAVAPLDPITTTPLAAVSGLEATATLAPVPEFATATEVSLPEEPLAADEPTATVETTDQDAPVDPATTLVTSTGDGGAAARDLELPEANIAPTFPEPAASEQETTSADSAPVATEEEPLAGGVPPLLEIASEKLAEQVEEAQAHGRDAVDEANSNARPAVDKDPLLQVEIPAENFAPEASTSAARFAPGVLMTCGGTTYCLFRQLQIAGESSFTEDDEEEEGAIKSFEEDRSTTGEDAPMILDELAKHDLYYQPVERLLETLRSTLPELDGEADELVLDFEDLGITLGEDNVYTRQVSLFDFDRLHLGCHIPGRLHVHIYAQPRFASGFNALAQHIANTYSSDGPADADAVDDEEAEEEEGEGAADDYDGPDSELPNPVAAEDDVDAEVSAEPDDGDAHPRKESDDEHNGEEEFDLDSALAQLDQDNIIAVVEGAQEDLMTDLPQHEEEEEGEEMEGSLEEPNDGQLQEGVDGEHVTPPETMHAQEEEQSVKGSEAEGEESWQIVEAEEAGGEPIAEAPTSSADADGVDATPVTDTSAPAAESSAEVRRNDADEQPVVEYADASGEDNKVDGNSERNAATEAPEASTSNVEQHPLGTETEHAQSDAVVENDVANGGAAPDAPKASEEIPDATADGADVVIDYDEAFDPTSVSEGQGSAEVTSATTTSTNDAPPSPKRSRSFDQVEEVNGADEDSANDAKRPRLADTAEAEVVIV